MNKISIALALVLAALAFWTQDEASLFQSAAASMDAASSFVVHPARCAQLLGHELHDDGLPPIFHADLEAALDATGLPSEPAMAQVGARCLQRLGQLDRTRQKAGA
jgi:hypothetical protein